ncbi:MAG: LPS-assembly protein LptD, partial [Muribaculaceae bacterium]|nr:LPS-assembly protein LptD [Muribaculaceae bacterium]
MRRSHLYIISCVLLCAISASAIGLPSDSRDDAVAAIGTSSTIGDNKSSNDSITITTIDSTATKNDSTKTLKKSLNTDVATSRIRRQKVDLDNIVEFSAKDSMVLIGQNSAYMYGDGKVTYGDMQLDAAEIIMDLNTSNVNAIGRTDSLGETTGSPIFKDKSGEYESKSMKYNFKSQRGYITDVVTEQGEGFLTGGKTKKMENGEFFLQDGVYTTCSNHENPHFYFQLTKSKVKPNSNIVTGPAYMVLAGLPLPLAVPFGYFPFTKDYSSGI